MGGMLPITWVYANFAESGISSHVTNTMLRLWYFHLVLNLIANVAWKSKHFPFSMEFLQTYTNKSENVLIFKKYFRIVNLETRWRVA